MKYPETAALIRAARIKRKWSQEKAAQIVGSSRLQWIRWEQGLHKPDPDGHGAALCDALNIPKKRMLNADASDEKEAALVADLIAIVRAITRQELERSAA